MRSRIALIVVVNSLAQVVCFASMVAHAFAGNWGWAVFFAFLGAANQVDYVRTVRDLKRIK